MLVRPFELRDLALLNRSAAAAPWEISSENAAIQAEEAVNGEVRWIVAEEDGQGVGLIEVITTAIEPVIIAYFYVEKADQMLSIAHWLLEAAVMLAFGRPIFIWVHKINPNFDRLVRMYERLGFRRTASLIPEYPFCMQLDYEVRYGKHRQRPD